MMIKLKLKIKNNNRKTHCKINKYMNDNKIRFKIFKNKNNNKIIQIGQKKKLVNWNRIILY